MSGAPLKILLIEDNYDHAELVIRNFEEHDVPNEIFHIADGEAAIKYLFRREEYNDPQKSPRPELILLDLRLPKVDGLEILKLVKEAKELRNIPVVILTTSKADKDVNLAYDYFVNSYLVKPLDFNEFSKMMSQLGLYWLHYNISPAN